MASVLDLIGETPLIEVTQFDRGPCRLFLKLESANPSGSIKDRPARAMIGAAEADGRLRPGGTIVEATAGNTGLGLALVGGRKGYRIVLVVPDKMAREKILHCKAMGAEVILTRSDVGRGHPDYYQDLAETITARTQGAFFINQFANRANPQAHEDATGPEILRHRNAGVVIFLDHFPAPPLGDLAQITKLIFNGLLVGRHADVDCGPFLQVSLWFRNGYPYRRSIQQSNVFSMPRTA
jgi:cystathionine beta-synthase